MFKIRMAGLVIELHNRYPAVRELCREFIIQEGEADLCVSATREEILAEQNGRDFSAGYCESLCLYRNICLQLPDFGGFLIHGAAIAVDGEAYLFLAKSGVGKTTHAGLWLDAFGDRARVVNGDKPILRRFEGRWHVCGTPWRGKENLGGSELVPLKALCFVERQEHNAIRPLEASAVTERIFHQLLMPREEDRVAAFFDLLEDLLSVTPAYLLKCNMSREAACLAYETMKNETKM